MINPKTYDGSIDDIQMIFNIIYKLEDIFVNNDIHNLNKMSTKILHHLYLL